MFTCCCKSQRAALTPTGTATLTFDDDDAFIVDDVVGVVVDDCDGTINNLRQWLIHGVIWATYKQQQISY